MRVITLPDGSTLVADHVATVFLNPPILMMRHGWGVSVGNWTGGSTSVAYFPGGSHEGSDDPEGLLAKAQAQSLMAWLVAELAAS